MAAPKGNQFWKARSSHGRKPIFKSPEQLEEASLEYFQWVEENPLWERKVFCFQGQVTEHDVPKMRAMSIEALTNFIDISLQTWHDYCSRKDFIEVTRKVKKIIESQQFEGAAAEFLSANIIARKLGLSDKKELSGPKGGPIQHDVNYRETAKSAIAEIEAEAASRENNE